MSVICVDAGTSLVKAVLFDRSGRELAVARQATVVERGPGGASEQDMDQVWDAVVHTVRIVRGQAVAAEPVTALAFTGQGDGCWLVDRSGRPTGPAILWNDARAGGIVDAWDRDGVLAEAYRINGTVGFAGTSGAILAWLRAHRPERLAAAYRALSCDGWLFLRLTGQFAADESDAAAPFLDIRSRRYSPELLSLFDLSWVERLLPEVRDDAHRVAELTGPAAETLGLPAGLPVVMAPFDIPATALGTGTLAPGQACTVLGTTLSTGLVLAAPDTTGPPVGMLLPSGAGGTYLRSLAAMAGVEVIGWAMRLLGLDHPERLSELAAAAPPGAGGLLLHPYLSPAGERAPFRDAGVRGSLRGLSLAHDRTHIARAVLEGMSLVVRDCLVSAGGDVAPTGLVLCGGGANNAFWCQLLADVTGVPTSRRAGAETGATGAFLTALVATGAEPSLPVAAGSYVRTRDGFPPDPARAGHYAELFDRFRALRPDAGSSGREL